MNMHFKRRLGLVLIVSVVSVGYVPDSYADDRWQDNFGIGRPGWGIDVSGEVSRAVDGALSLAADLIKSGWTWMSDQLTTQEQREYKIVQAAEAFRRKALTEGWARWSDPGRRSVGIAIEQDWQSARGILITHYRDDGNAEDLLFNLARLSPPQQQRGAPEAQESAEEALRNKQIEGCNVTSNEYAKNLDVIKMKLTEISQIYANIVTRFNTNLSPPPSQVATADYIGMYTDRYPNFVTYNTTQQEALKNLLKDLFPQLTEAMQSGRFIVSSTCQNSVDMRRTGIQQAVWDVDAACNSINRWADEYKGEISTFRQRLQNQVNEGRIALSQQRDSHYRGGSRESWRRTEADYQKANEMAAHVERVGDMMVSNLMQQKVTDLCRGVTIPVPNR